MCKRNAIMDFCKESYTLLQPVTTGELKFKSDRTGAEYPAKPEHTLLAAEEIKVVQSVLKYKNTLSVTAFDPTNPRSDIGCDKCGRAIVSFQRLGEEKKVVYVCICGNQFGV